MPLKLTVSQFPWYIYFDRIDTFVDSDSEVNKTLTSGQKKKKKITFISTPAHYNREIQPGQRMAGTGEEK